MIPLFREANFTLSKTEIHDISTNWIIRKFQQKLKKKKGKIIEGGQKINNEKKKTTTKVDAQTKHKAKTKQSKPLQYELNKNENTAGLTLMCHNHLQDFDFAFWYEWIRLFKNNLIQSYLNAIK